MWEFKSLFGHQRCIKWSSFWVTLLISLWNYLPRRYRIKRPRYTPCYEKRYPPKFSHDQSFLLMWSYIWYKKRDQRRWAQSWGLPQVSPVLYWWKTTSQDIKRRQVLCSSEKSWRAQEVIHSELHNNPPAYAGGLFVIMQVKKSTKNRIQTLYRAAKKKLKRI